MSCTICLRCDRSGETRSKKCPACGTDLFASEPREKARRATRQPGPRRRSANNHPPLDEVPAGSLDAGDAYVLGRYRGIRGVYRITMAPGIGLRVPELVDRTEAAAVVCPLTLPPGAPRPAGPLPWTVSSSGATGSAS